MEDPTAEAPIRRPAPRRRPPAHAATSASATPAAPAASPQPPREPVKRARPAARRRDPAPVPAESPIATVVGAEIASDEVDEVDEDKLLAHLDLVLVETALVELTPEPAPRTGFTPTTEPVQAPPATPPLWARVVADPGFAAEHLVRDAVRVLGPAAQAWVERTRERYPVATVDAVARLAVADHVRVARRQALASTTTVGSIADVGLLGRTHAKLVLTVAAVYGVDPTAEARHHDLLELLAIPRLTQPAPAAARNVGRVLGALAVRRATARLLPFGAAIAGSIHSGRTTELLGLRAINRFRPKR